MITTVDYIRWSLADIGEQIFQLKTMNVAVTHGSFATQHSHMNPRHPSWQTYKAAKRRASKLLTQMAIIKYGLLDKLWDVSWVLDYHKLWCHMPACSATNFNHLLNREGDWFQQNQKEARALTQLIEKGRRRKNSDGTERFEPIDLHYVEEWVAAYKVMEQRRKEEQAHA